MLNRAVGLLLAKQRLEKTDELSKKDKDFIERNIFKATMAAGDAFLICNHTFDHSYVRRMELMDDFKENPMIKDNDFLNRYKQSIMYKLKPERKNRTREQLNELYQRILEIFKVFFLFTAEKCWNRKLVDFEDFSKCASTKTIDDAESPLYVLKNIVLNAKEVGFSSFSVNWFVKYPRYRLFYSIPYIAFSEKSYEKRIPSALGLPPGATEEEKLRKFMKLWERFN